MSLKRALISRINRLGVVDRHVYTAHHGPARGLKRQGGMGWLPGFLPRPHEWEAEEEFLDRRDWTGLTVYDVGGDQGLYSLFFAARVGPGGRVIVFEPNPRSYERIQVNIQLNSFANVRVLPVGLGAASATLQFAFPSNEPARGSASPSIRAEIATERDVKTCDIEVVALDHEIMRTELPPPDFIKIDVEGMEWQALSGMRETLRQHRPALHIEMHGIGQEEKTTNACRVVRLLEEAEYTILHVESQARITRANAALAYCGHLYCTPGQQSN